MLVVVWALANRGGAVVAFRGPVTLDCCGPDRSEKVVKLCGIESHSRFVKTGVWVCVEECDDKAEET